MQDAAPEHVCLGAVADMPAGAVDSFTTIANISVGAMFTVLLVVVRSITQLTNSVVVAVV